MRMTGALFYVLAILSLTAILGAMPGPAEAKGCLKGGAVGGVAGHYAGHHGVLGAAAGCLIGRHEAKKQQQNRTPEGGNTNSSQ